MALVPGTRIGPYEILTAIGAGGMGEVYRASDTRLNRDVAIKVLLPAVANDPDRLARFSREAQVLASLNHPNIAHIHGLEDTNGIRALVMELVEGPTLADRITRGPVPLDEALPIARQIAEALEAAHEQGIVHRDLKPANIKVRPDGTVKVLDFGLAKALDSAAAQGGNPASASMSPTITTPAMTLAGIILGTAAYMSPEQARGKPVDRRADIWAFGVVFYEMLTGRRAFDAEDISATLAFVITKEPDWTALPAATPDAIRRLLRRCLEKDPKRRVPDIAIARIEIDDALAPARAEGDTGSGLRKTLGARGVPPSAVVAALAGGALIAALATWVATRPAPIPPAPVSRFALTLPASQPLAIAINDRDLAIASDGTRLVYTAGTERQLVVRSFERLDTTPIAGISNARAPFLSPDGRWVGFFDFLDEGVNNSTPREGYLKKVPVAGGQPIVICKIVGGSRGASWGSDDSIVFATSDRASGLLRVSARGGEPMGLTKPDPAKGQQYFASPSVLPGARAVLFTIFGRTYQDRQVAVFDVKSGRSKVLVDHGGQAAYVETGHLLYVVDGSLWAVRFDVASLEVQGDAVPVGERAMSRNIANFDVSPRGTLAYVPTANEGGARSLVWVSREGREESIAAPPRVYRQVRVSPDGTRAAVVTGGGPQGVVIWMWDFARSVLTRLTLDTGYNGNPVWTPDGRFIVFQSGPGAQSLSRRAADGTGTPEELTSGPRQRRPTSISPDGKRLVFEEPMPNTAYDLMVMGLDGTSRPEPLLQTPFDERNGDISPDGRWLAYESNESGRNEIYVRPFPNVRDGQYLISTGGGRTPAWSRSGRELFFINGSSLLTAQVQLTPVFTAGNATKLFDAPSMLLDGRFLTSGGTYRMYDVSHDDRRFLMIKNAAPLPDDRPTGDIVVVQNWSQELKRLLPAK